MGKMHGLFSSSPKAPLASGVAKECKLEHQDGQVRLGKTHQSNFLIAVFGLGILQGSPGEKRADDIFPIATDGLPVAIMFLEAVDHLGLGHLIRKASRRPVWRATFNQNG